MNILHLSDLHYSYGDSTQYNFIKKPLLADLRRLQEFSTGIDAIVLSGDLVYDPDEEDIYFHLFDILEEILTLTKLSFSDLVICPGNHDVSRISLFKEKKFREELIPHLTDSSALSDMFVTGRLDSYQRSINQAFFEFAEYCGQAWKNPFFRVTSGKGDVLPFVCLNSTLFCGLEGSRADSGKLAIPSEAFEQALRELGTDKRASVVFHHPVNELTDPYRSALHHRLANRSDLILFGHVHDPKPIFEIAPGGSSLFLQSGALFEKNDRFRGYCVYEVDRTANAKRVVYRSYQQNRDEFDLGLNVVADGVFYPSAQDKRFFAAKKPRYTPEQLVGFLTGPAYAELAGKLNETAGDERLEDVYVSPPFVYRSDDRIDEDLAASARAYSLEKIKAADENLVVFFAEAAGATSFVNNLALSYSNSPEEFQVARIPICLDIQEGKPYPAAVTRTLRQNYPVLDDPIFGWTARLVDQPFVVLIDNFDPFDTSDLEWLSEAHRQLPRARFIVAAKSGFVGQYEIRPDLKLPFEYRALLVREFRRGEIRKLIQKYKLPPSLDENLILNEIISRFQAMSVPFYAPTIVLYLIILKEKGKYAPLNASTILENFVDNLLGKTSSDFIFLEDFDYAEQTTILTILVEEMVRRELDALPYEEVYEIVQNHYSSVEIERAAQTVINYFLERKVLANNANLISIKQRLVRSYLVARRMSNSKTFRDYILEPPRHSKFVHEIDVYCGLNRADVDTLNKLSENYVSYRDAVFSLLGEFVDTTKIVDLLLPKTDNLDEFMSKVTSSVIDGPRGSQADEKIGREDRRADRYVERMREPASSDAIVLWVLSLNAYSVAAKGLEEVHRDEKQRHVTIVLEGWAALTALAVRLVAVAFEDGVVEFAGRKVKFELGHALSGSVMRALIMNIPRFVSGYCRLYFATDKLAVQFRGDNLTPMSSFIATGLVADLKSKEYLGTIKRYMSRFRNSPFMLESLMWKLRDTFMRFGVSDTDLASIKAVVADLDADILGLHGTARNERISSTLQKLDRKRLLRARRENPTG